MVTEILQREGDTSLFMYFTVISPNKNLTEKYLLNLRKKITEDMHTSTM